MQAGSRSGFEVTNAVEGSELGIEQHALAAQDENRARNVLNRNAACLCQPDQAGR